MWRSGLAVANCFANGRECLTEQIFSSPFVWILGAGVIRPETNNPHWVQRTGLRQKIVTSAQKVKFHGWVLRKIA